jgi:hypothetical protein
MLMMNKITRIIILKRKDSWKKGFLKIRLRSFQKLFLVLNYKINHVMTINKCILKQIEIRRKEIQ